MVIRCQFYLTFNYALNESLSHRVERKTKKMFTIGIGDIKTENLNNPKLKIIYSPRR